MGRKGSEGVQGGQQRNGMAVFLDFYDIILKVLGPSISLFPAILFSSPHEKRV